jgi:hypothetical protein
MRIFGGKIPHALPNALGKDYMLRDVRNRSIPPIKGGEEHPSTYTNLEKRKRRGTPPFRATL